MRIDLSSSVKEPGIGEPLWQSPVDESSAYRKIEAESLNTLPERLATLLTDSNFWIRRSALANPSCPEWAVDLLVKAGAKPDLSAREVSTDVLSASEMRHLYEMCEAEGDWGFELLAAHPSTSEHLLNLLTDKSVAIRRLVAAHANSGAEALGRLMLDDDAGVRSLAAKHIEAPETVKFMIDRFEHDHEDSPMIDAATLSSWAMLGSFARRLISKYPWTPWPLIEKLLKDASHEVRVSAASHTAIPEDEQLQLAERMQKTLDYDLAIALSQNPAVTDHVLAELVSINHAGLRQQIAQHPAAGEKTLLWLATDGNGQVRQQVLKHANFTAEMLQILVRAGSTPDLLQFSAPDASQAADELAQLAEMGLWGQRLAARHPATPQYMLKYLCTHADPLIRMSAVKHPKLDQAWLKKFSKFGTSGDLQEFINPDLTMIDHDFLVSLLDCDLWARQLVARHPDCGVKREIVDQLLTDEPIVRKQLAENTWLTADRLMPLIMDSSPDIRWAMVRRSDLTDEMIEQLAKDPVPAIQEVAQERLG